MTGYSGTPLSKKLGIKAGQRLLVLGGPARFTQDLDLPEDVQLSTALRGSAAFDVVILFVEQRALLETTFPKLAARTKSAGAIWAAWPKASAKKRLALNSDMTEHAVRAVILPLGYVDNKVAAIDDTWSALRCVLRLENR
jgi:hypothetical protein